MLKNLSQLCPSFRKWASEQTILTLPILQNCKTTWTFYPRRTSCLWVSKILSQVKALILILRMYHLRSKIPLRLGSSKTTWMRSSPPNRFLTHLRCKSTWQTDSRSWLDHACSTVWCLLPLTPRTWVQMISKLLNQLESKLCLLLLAHLWLMTSSPLIIIRISRQHQASLPKPRRDTTHSLLSLSSRAFQTQRLTFGERPQWDFWDTLTKSESHFNSNSHKVSDQVTLWLTLIASLTLSAKESINMVEREATSPQPFSLPGWTASFGSALPPLSSLETSLNISWDSRTQSLMAVKTKNPKKQNQRKSLPSALEVKRSQSRKSQTRWRNLKALPQPWLDLPLFHSLSSQLTTQLISWWT